MSAIRSGAEVRKARHRYGDIGMKGRTGCPIRGAALASSLFFSLLPAIAQADVTIPTHATMHMSCVAGVCTPTAATSYAAGQITAVSNFGGVAGTNNGSLSQVYWDINDTGATGLTRTQMQSALPAGFDPAIWGLAATIDNGLPYLPANPPR